MCFTHSIIWDEQLNSSLCNFSDIIVAFLHSQSSKTQGRLATTPYRKCLHVSKDKCHVWGFVYFNVVIQNQLCVRDLWQSHWPCFFGRSTVNLWRTSLVFPQSVPKSAPLPSITINPNLLSSARRAFRAWRKNRWKLNRLLLWCYHRITAIIRYHLTSSQIKSVPTFRGNAYVEMGM